MNAATLPQQWAACIDLLKDRINNRSFWEAIERTRPIAIEGDTLIIGLDSANFNHATQLQQPARMNTINQTVSEQFQRNLQVRLIEGATPADWESVKEREQRVIAMRQAEATRQVAQDVRADSWESVNETISRIYAQFPNRSFPQTKARFANEALYTLVEAMDTLYPDEPDEAAERSLARALDRIATSSEIPAPVLAFELERLRAWRRSDAENGDDGEAGTTTDST